MLKFINACSATFIHTLYVSIHPMLKFINNLVMLYQIDCGSFNTSHVKVYRKKSKKMNTFLKGFNTSHVKVYHKEQNGTCQYANVSIHPMLKFIPVMLKADRTVA